MEKEQSLLVWISHIFFYTGSILITLWRQIGQIPPPFLICSNIFIQKNYLYKVQKI